MTAETTAVAAETFRDALETFAAGPQGYFVTVHPLETYRASTLYLSADGRTGAAVSPAGELFSLFSTGGRGEGARAVGWALEHGATWLECFAPTDGGGLVAYYRRHGFDVAESFPFDPAYADDPRQVQHLGDGWSYFRMTLRTEAVAA